MGVLDRGVGLGHLEVELLRVDFEQDLACIDMLVVAHQHLGHVARDPGKDGTDMPLDRGVIGLLVGRVVVPVPESHDHPDDQGDGGNGPYYDLGGRHLGPG
jgi:hypothetical protein